MFLVIKEEKMKNNIITETLKIDRNLIVIYSNCIWLGVKKSTRLKELYLV